MTEQEIKAQVLAALSPDENEAVAKKAVANLIASLLVNLQRIADAVDRSPKG